jgi:hypothetical protein
MTDRIGGSFLSVFLIVRCHQIKFFKDTGARWPEPNQGTTAQRAYWPCGLGCWHCARRSGGFSTLRRAKVLQRYIPSIVDHIFVLRSGSWLTAGVRLTRFRHLVPVPARHEFAISPAKKDFFPPATRPVYPLVGVLPHLRKHGDYRAPAFVAKSTLGMAIHGQAPNHLSRANAIIGPFVISRVIHGVAHFGRSLPAGAESCRLRVSEYLGGVFLDVGCFHIQILRSRSWLISAFAKSTSCGSVSSSYRV